MPQDDASFYVENWKEKNNKKEETDGTWLDLDRKGRWGYGINETQFVTI